MEFRLEALDFCPKHGGVFSRFHGGVEVALNLLEIAAQQGGGDYVGTGFLTVRSGGNPGRRRSALLLACSFFLQQSCFAELVSRFLVARLLLSICRGCQKRFGQVDQVDAVHWAWGDAQITAGAFAADDGVGEFCGTYDGIHGACLDALGAANTLAFTDHGYLPAGRCDAKGRVKGQGGFPEQVSEGIYGVLTTRHTMVDGFTVGDGIGIGLAARVLALAALGLGKQGLDGIHHRDALTGGEGGASSHRCRDMGWVVSIIA